MYTYVSAVAVVSVCIIHTYCTVLYCICFGNGVSSLYARAVRKYTHGDAVFRMRILHLEVKYRL